MGAMGSLRSASCARAIVALGNPYRTDDGVGVHLLRRLAVTCQGVGLLEAVHDGMRLAEAIRGYEKVLLVDASPWLPVGEVRRLRLEELPARAGYFHGMGFRAALEALERAGENVPVVEILAIGIPPDPPFGEGLSPEVEAALPRALEEVQRWLNP